MVLDGLLAAAVFLTAVLVRPDRPEFPELSWPTTVLLALASAVLVLRRRFPVGVWAATLALGVVGVLLSDGLPQGLIPAFVGLFTVASWRERRVALTAALVTVAAMAVVMAATVGDERWSTGVYVLLAWTGMVTASGVAVRNRRAVVAAAVERAQRAEQTREEEARRRVTEERLRIARELHDVVAHHIAVINVQAGVARHLVDSAADGTTPAAVRDALGHVRDAAEVVLGELATILGLLRGSGETDSTQPAPGLAQLDELVDSMRRTGLEITSRISGRAVTLPPGTDLVAYRLLQEALTNAGKYGTGSVELAVAHASERVTLTVTNPVYPTVTRPGLTPAEVARPAGAGLAGRGGAEVADRAGAGVADRVGAGVAGPGGAGVADRAGAGVAGPAGAGPAGDGTPSGGQVAEAATGYGLVGMRERVAAVGGTVRAGPGPGGRFVVHAELPTEAPR